MEKGTSHSLQFTLLSKGLRLCRDNGKQYPSIKLLFLIIISARQTRGPRDAHFRIRSIPLLHHMDTPHGTAPNVDYHRHSY